MTKRYQNRQQKFEQLITGSAEMGRTKVLSIWPAYDNTYVAQLQSTRDKSLPYYVVHFDQKGTKLRFFCSKKVTMLMLNDQEIIALDVPANQVSIFSLKTQHKLVLRHEYLAHHRTELFIFPATNTFCICQNRQNSLKLTYYTCQNIPYLQQQNIAKYEVISRHARTRTAQKVNDYSKIMWQSLSHRDPNCFYLEYFQLEDNPCRKVKEMIVQVDVKGVESNQELLQLKHIWQLSQDKYLVYGLGEEELGNQESSMVLPGLNIKLENHYFNGFFIMAVDSMKALAELTKIKTWKDIEFESQDSQDHTLKILGEFSQTSRKAMIEIHPTLHLNLNSSHPSPPVNSYYVNLRNLETGDQMSHCLSYASTSVENVYIVYESKQYDLKAEYLWMLENINEDFDEDLLMDVTELLIK